MHQSLTPKSWPRPKGYSNGIVAEGRFVFTAGIIGWDEKEQFTEKEFIGQFHQALKNTVAVLSEAGAHPEHIVRMTCYVTDKHHYKEGLSDIGAIWRDVLGRVFPCMAVVQVVALIEDEALVEIETTAVIPSGEQA